eukprot:g8790.t1
METLEESTEPLEHSRNLRFDATQYSFFNNNDANTRGLELGSSTSLEEGVEAPPEEDFFKTPSNELDSSLEFDGFYDGHPPHNQQQQQQQFKDYANPQQSVLFVSDLEKHLQMTTLRNNNNKTPTLTVTEVENQTRGGGIKQNPDSSRETNYVQQQHGFFPFPVTTGGHFNFNNATSSASFSPELGNRAHHQQQKNQFSPVGSTSRYPLSGLSPFITTGSGPTSNSSSSTFRPPPQQPSLSLSLSGERPPLAFSPPQFAPSGMSGGLQHSSSAIQKYKYMTSLEIEKILSFQVQNIHVQNPYSDDYYYHAFIKKYRRGSCRFTPVSFKEAEHQEQAMKAEVKFADLQGLGKIPFSNLRTPRPLIDFLDNESLASAEEYEALHSIQWEFIRSAHRQQAMQARKLIEDSMCLLLEVDDVDRLAISECGKVDLRRLASRRRDLIGSIVEAFRIPSTPEGNVSNPAPTGKHVVNSDGVFLRLMSIAKGRSLLAKLLNVLVPPRPFQALPTDTNPLSHICWTTLRNIRALFGPPTWITKQGIDVDVSSVSDETSKIAVGLREVILALRSANDVCCAFEALAKGDLMSSDGSVVTPEDLLLPLLPPNHIPGKKTGVWLEHVLVALLQRALEVGLAQRICFTHPTGAFIDFELMMKWDEVFGVLYDALTAHLKILGQVQLVAKERNQPQALQYADGLRGSELLRAALTLCNQSQLHKLKQLVSALL